MGKEQFDYVILDQVALEGSILLREATKRGQRLQSNKPRSLSGIRPGAYLIYTAFARIKKLK